MEDSDGDFCYGAAAGVDMAQSALYMQEHTLQAILEHLDLDGALADFNRLAIIIPTDVVAALADGTSARVIREVVHRHLPHDDVRVPIENAMIDVWMRDNDLERYRYVQNKRIEVLRNKRLLMDLLQQQMTTSFQLSKEDADECARCMLEGAHVVMLLTRSVEWVTLLQQCWPADKARPLRMQQREFAGAMHRLGTDAVQRMTAALARMRDARDGLFATRKRKRGCEVSDEEGTAASATATLPMEVQHAVRVVRDAMQQFAATYHDGSHLNIDPFHFARLVQMDDDAFAAEIGAMTNQHGTSTFLHQIAAQDDRVKQALETLQQLDFDDLYT